MAKKIKSNVLIVGLACLTILEITALLCGINGTVFTMVIGVIAGLLGWTLPQPQLN